MKIALLGLTGFANPVLSALADNPGIEIACVLTERERGPFPYYPTEPLEALCHGLGLPCFSDLPVSSPASTERLKRFQPDLLLVATFRQILSRETLAIPGTGTVNLHPSLLPRHRGPCPSQAALLDGSRTTGVTAHRMERTVDTGNILLQRPLAIHPDDNDGRLRQRLASIAGEMIPDLIALLSRTPQPAGNPQDPALTTTAGRLAPETGFLETATDIGGLIARLRATTPLPGASIAFDGQRIPIQHWEPIASTCENGIRPVPGGAFEVHIDGQGVRLYPPGLVPNPFVAQETRI